MYMLYIAISCMQKTDLLRENLKAKAFKLYIRIILLNLFVYNYGVAT